MVTGPLQYYFRQICIRITGLKDWGNLLRSVYLMLPVSKAVSFLLHGLIVARFGTNDIVAVTV